MDIASWIDAGVAVILLTLIVKFILYPLAKSAVLTQRSMKLIEPKIKELREQYKTDPKLQASKMMELYKEYKINPFATFATLLIQLPILFAVYSIFSRSGFPEIKTNLLYAFVQVPEPLHSGFLGLVSLGDKSLVFAILSGICVFAQMKVTMLITDNSAQNKDIQDGSPEAMMKNMMKGIVYIIPFFVAIAGFQSVAIALYFIASSLFGVAQDLYLKKYISPRLNAQTTA